MKQGTHSPVVKRLILVGGGHSHLAVLKRLAMHPVPGLETLLITREVHTPYSGSLPACVAGLYSRDSMHIDLRPLAQFAGARLIQAQVSRLDLQNHLVLLADRPPLYFDLLSLNIGSRPDASRIPGAGEFAVGVKPIDQFLSHWDTVRRSAVARLNAGAPYNLLIVGGGPASVELACAARQGIGQDTALERDRLAQLQIRLLTADSDVLLSHNAAVRQAARRAMQEQAIELLTDCRVTEFRRNRVVSSSHGELEADAIFYATGASVPTWPGDCGLQVDAQGFIAVNTALQSLSHPCVFASGDVASILGYPRPKSGVYAVRQGGPLADNLIRYATGQRLRSYIPQKHALALLYIGNRRALASRNTWCFQGRWVWHWKHRIDQRFLKKYREFPELQGTLELAPGLLERKSEQALKEHAIRCSGCGAKVGGSLLSTVLRELAPALPPDVVAPIGGVEDAAQIVLGPDRRLLQTVDYLPAFTRDPWLFARVTSNHCLGDIFAMGATPHSALAIAGIPFARDRFMAETLRELMTGCLSVLDAESTALIGGHSLESAQLGFGLSVNGFAPPERLLGKSGVRAGDVLILCKALGSGVLLAADMRYRAQGRWMSAAFESMLQSCASAAACFVQHQANACTDITGFGLAGHLLEMLNPTRAQAELTLNSLPVLDGALECLEAGLRSSLHGDNRLTAQQVFNQENFRQSPRYELLFDPQTAGGLLASVPAGEAQACLESLRQRGYVQAAVIGNVVMGERGQAAVVLR